MNTGYACPRCRKGTLHARLSKDRSGMNIELECYTKRNRYEWKGALGNREIIATNSCGYTETHYVDRLFDAPKCESSGE